MEDENKITSKIAMPSAAKIIKEKKLDISDIASTGVNNRVTKGDVLLYLNQIKTEDGLKVKNINKEKQINVRKGSGMDVLVPVLGESVVEATVSKWIKKQGEFVEVDDPIVELETDKVTLEVPAVTSGILDNLTVSEGDTVEVGALLGIIIAGEKSDETPAPAPKQEDNKIDEQVSVPEKVESKISSNKSDVIEEAVNKNLEERVPMSR